MRKLIKKILLNLPIIRGYILAIEDIQKLNLSYKDQLEKQSQIIDNSRSPGLMNNRDDYLTERLMSHPVKKLNSQLVFTSSPANHNDKRIKTAERLICAYHKAIEDESKSVMNRDGEDLWTGLIRNELPDLMKAIEGKDPESLADFLESFGNSYVWFGGITTCIDGYNKNLEPQHVALTYYDKLVSIAEYLGILKIENPESGSWGDNLNIDIDYLVNKIEDCLNISIMPPLGIIHTDGVKTSGGILHYRHINSLYSAIKTLRLAGKDSRVCEFGGGLGISALYSLRLGVSKYMILDLPITCLLSGHYLIEALGGDSVSLYGEDGTNKSVEIMPYWKCKDLPDKYFNVTLNQDSLPEIDDNLIREYLNQIQRITNGKFFSINHEVFFPRTVSIFASENKKFHQISRDKCWVREGYIDEVYDFKIN